MTFTAIVSTSCRARLLCLSVVFAVASSCVTTGTPTDAAAGYSLELIARGAGDSVDMDRPLLIRSGPNGLIYTGVQRKSGLPMVLDSLANIVRVIGRRGPGPGELESVSQVYPKADSIVVGDLRGDLALFAPDGGFVRTLNTRVTTIGQTLLMRGDTLLLAEPIFSIDRFGLPLHLLAPNGDTVRSFGSTDRTFDRRVMSRLVRHVARVTDSTVWVARHDRYQIERWHMNGTLLQTIIGQREWFPPLQADWDGSTAKTYPTILRDVHQDRDGHLIVMMERARTGFIPTSDASRHESRTTTSLLDRLTFLEQVVEVLDANSGALIATVPTPTDAYLMRSLADDRIVGIGVDAGGSDVPILYRLTHPSIP